MRASPRGRDEPVYRLLGRCEYNISGLGDINGSGRSEQDLIEIFTSYFRWA